MFQIVVTARPSDQFGVEGPIAFAEPRVFGGFQSTKGSRYGSLTGYAPEVKFAGSYSRHAERKPAQWSSREAAERNLARLVERGYRGEVVEVQG